MNKSGTRESRRITTDFYLTKFVINILWKSTEFNEDDWCDLVMSVVLSCGWRMDPDESWLLLISQDGTSKREAATVIMMLLLLLLLSVLTVFIVCQGPVYEADSEYYGHCRARYKSSTQIYILSQLKITAWAFFSGVSRAARVRVSYLGLWLLRRLLRRRLGLQLLRLRSGQWFRLLRRIL